MKPGSSRDEGPTAALCERIHDLAARIGREWRLAVRVEDDGIRTPLSLTAPAGGCYKGSFGGP
jgi:hypothetical protein